MYKNKTEKAVKYKRSITVSAIIATCLLFLNDLYCCTEIKKIDQTELPKLLESELEYIWLPVRYIYNSPLIQITNKKGLQKKKKVFGLGCLKSSPSSYILNFYSMALSLLLVILYYLNK